MSPAKEKTLGFERFGIYSSDVDRAFSRSGCDSALASFRFMSLPLVCAFTKRNKDQTAWFYITRRAFTRKQDYVDQEFSNALCLLTARLFATASYSGGFSGHHNIHASSK